MTESLYERCCEDVYPAGLSWSRPYQCRRNAVIERDGCKFCKQHDPVAVKARHDAADAKQRAAMEAQMAAPRRALNAARAEAVLAFAAEVTGAGDLVPLAERFCRAQGWLPQGPKE